MPSRRHMINSVASFTTSPSEISRRGSTATTTTSIDKRTRRSLESDYNGNGFFLPIVAVFTESVVWVVKGKKEAGGDTYFLVSSDGDKHEEGRGVLVAFRKKENAESLRSAIRSVYYDGDQEGFVKWPIVQKEDLKHVTTVCRTINARLVIMDAGPV